MDESGKRKLRSWPWAATIASIIVLSPFLLLVTGLSDAAGEVAWMIFGPFSFGLSSSSPVAMVSILGGYWLLVFFISLIVIRGVRLRQLEDASPSFGEQLRQQSPSHTPGSSEQNHKEATGTNVPK